MTSYERVRRAIEFARPDRPPVRFPSLGLNDTAGVGVAGMGKTEINAHESIDIWGCRWEKTDVPNMGQVKGHPLADWAKLDDYEWPEPDEPTRYGHLDEALAKVGDKYITVGAGNCLFERLYFLHGYEGALLDMYAEPKKVHFVLDKLTDWFVGLARNIGKYGKGRVHGYSVCDDWGTQDRSATSVEMFREFFKPRYKRIIDAVHEAGMHMWIHSCGKVNDIVGEWIDVGLDVVNLQQPTALGIDEMGQRFQGKICFESLCDIQTTLPNGTDEDLRDELDQLLTLWGTPDGGFIFSDYGDGNAIGVPIERKQVMFAAFRELVGWQD